MSRIRYDFREANSFLNDCVPLDDLYDDVCAALLMLNRRRLSSQKKDEIWHTLLSCADLLETITPKEKGGKRGTAA